MIQYAISVNDLEPAEIPGFVVIEIEPQRFHRGKARLQDLDVFGPTLERGHTAAPVEKKAGVVTDARADLKNLPAGEIESEGSEMLKAPAVMTLVMIGGKR